MLETLAHVCYRRRRRVLTAWLFVFLGLGILGSVAAGPFSTNFRIPGSGSKAALDLLEQRFPARAGDSIDLVFKADAGVGDETIRARTEALLADLARFDHVVSTLSPYSPGGAPMVSPDGTVAFARIQLDVQGADMPHATAKKMIANARAAGAEGVRYELSGQAILDAEFVTGSGELLGLLAAVVVLLICFGSVLAMGLPILTAVLGVGIGLSIVELLTHVVDVPNITPIIAAMVGLGVGIDYALFIVTRYRVGLSSGLDPEDAAVAAITTAGRAVLFAGTTVVISVLGMLLMGLPFLRGVAFGASATVAATMMAALTLLPAMLGFVGTNIDRLRVPFVSGDLTHQRTGFWFRWSRLIQRRPWPGAVVGGVTVLLLAVPLLSLRLGVPGPDSQPPDRSTRRSFDLFVEGFGPGFSAPLLLAARLPGPEGAEILHQLGDRLRAEPGVASVTPPQLNPEGDAAVMTVFPTTGGDSRETAALVKRLHDGVVPAATAGSGVTVDIGGPTALFIDSSEAIQSRLPVFITVVVLLSFLLLTAVFRSVPVALKAAVMNLLSIGAAYGVVVAVAQWGWLKGVFGITAVGPIANFVPMIMFAILFGLSMDYEVFLLSRIREEYLRTGDNGLAVADGLASTARVITAAAVIMITVFLAFVLGPELIIKQMGLGLAAAVLIDASLIRMLLVPSTMELLGRANWWLPRWLDRLLPSLRVEGRPAETEPAERPTTLVGAAGQESR